MGCEQREVWGSLLRGRCLLWFADNTAAVAGCVSGYSRSVYVTRLAGITHELLCHYDITAWFEWVHTASNPLDAASRHEGENALRELGASVIQVKPDLKIDLQEYHPASGVVVQ